MIGRLPTSPKSDHASHISTSSLEFESSEHAENGSAETLVPGLARAASANASVHAKHIAGVRVGAAHAGQTDRRQRSFGPIASGLYGPKMALNRP